MIEKVERENVKSMYGFSVVDVVNKGFCSGCGVCAVKSSEISMNRRLLGVIEPDLTQASHETLELANRICPFSDSSPNEDQMGASLYSDECENHSSEIGFYKFIGAGSVVDDRTREFSSSGGLTTWILTRLFELGLVDGVIHVGSGPATNSNDLFSYSISRSVEDLRRNRKSKYYATEVSQVLKSIKGDGCRYAFVGIPCFVSAVRNLSNLDADYQSQIVYYIGLICGHLKSTRFSQLMAWQLGVTPDDLSEVDFRIKVKTGGADQYHFGAKSKSTGKWTSARAGALYGGDWGYAFFQLKACDYCDDIFVESADVVLGDAWIPQYTKDWLGTNIVVSRREFFNEVLFEGRKQGTIKLDDLSESDLLRSQAGNFRHRREGLSLRLLDCKNNNEFFPEKRVQPGSYRLSFWRKRIVRLRKITSSKSHLAFDRAIELKDLSEFKRQMLPVTKSMANTYRWMRLCSLRGFVEMLLRRIKLR